MSQEKEHIVKSATSTVGTKLAIHFEEENLMQQNEKMDKIQTEIHSKSVNRWHLEASTIMHILVMIFGISAWIGVNGIFIQLPLLVNSAPESWGLAAYVVVAIQIANAAPIIYSLLRNSSMKINESHFIFGMLGVGSFVMLLLAFLYDKTSVIASRNHSTALFVLTFFTAAVCCSSSILFMPYLRNFKEIYLISYFIGEGLSGVLPSFVALIQGIGDNPSCEKNKNTTEIPDASLPRFSPQYYFIFIFMCLILSLVAFFLLEKLSYIKKERISHRTKDNNPNYIKTKSYNCQKQVSVLTEGSISENSVIDKNDSIDNYKKTEVGEVSNVFYVKNNRLTLKNLYLYVLLSLICLLANGFLPGLQPYSCLSYGNMTYHLSATFSQIANPTACFLALWYLPHNKKIINWLSVTIFLISGYIIYLAAVSPNPPFQNSWVGGTLVILSWIVLIGLISYVKLIITSVFRRKFEKSLFHVGVAMQTGSACGAVLSFVLINFTNSLQEYKPCNGS